MMILAVILLFIGLAIALNTLFVVVYNRYLSMMHESTLKKIVALAGLPMGSVLSAVSALIFLQIPKTLQLLLLIVSISGWLIGFYRVWRLTRQKKRDWDPGLSTDLYEFPEATNSSRLKLSHRIMLMLLRPINSVGTLKVHRSTIQMSGAGHEFDGYKIVHLTDFHLHHTLKMEWFEFVIERIMAERPDLILFGGDLISKYAHVAHVAPYLKKLSAPDGVVLIGGNHDFWKSPQRLRRYCLEAGYKCLSNSALSISRNGSKLNILGFETPYIPLTTQERINFKGLEGPRIGLIHTPEAYKQAQEVGCDIALSGHTHGGQVRLPFFGTTICGCPVPVELADGRSQMGKMKTWTSRGVGAFFPFRFRCAPELICLTLKS